MNNYAVSSSGTDPHREAADATLLIGLDQIEHERALQLARKGKTGQLSHGEEAGLSMFRPDQPMTPAKGHPKIITLPRTQDGTSPFWLIELQLEPGGIPQGIALAGDVVLGVRRHAQEPPDFDLAPYGGLEKGVSRRHAILRPGRNRLYVIDLRSTNGTHVNGLPVKHGFAAELCGGDILTLGALSITVRYTGGLAGGIS